MAEKQFEVTATNEIALYGLDHKGLYPGEQYTVLEVKMEEHCAECGRRTSECKNSDPCRKTIDLQFITIETANEKLSGLSSDCFEKASS